MKIFMPLTALAILVIPAVLLVGCFGDTGTIQDQLPRYSDMGAAADAGKAEGN